MMHVGSVNDIVSALEATLKNKSVSILTAGNELRGDDFIGSYIARKLKERGLRNVIDGDLSPESFIELAIKNNPDILLIIDAIEAGLKPGTLVFGELGEIVESEIVIPTTHKPSYSLIQVYVKYRSPKTQCFFLGIQVGNVNFGAKMSPEIMNVGDGLVKVLSDILK